MSKILLEYMSNKRGPRHDPGERHNEDEIHLKALPEQIFVVFLKIDKSRTTKQQLHSDPALILNVLAKY